MISTPAIFSLEYPLDGYRPFTEQDATVFAQIKSSDGFFWVSLFKGLGFAKIGAKQSAQSSGGGFADRGRR
jgi:hypothetical protein